MRMAHQLCHSMPQPSSTRTLEPGKAWHFCSITCELLAAMQTLVMLLLGPGLSMPDNVMQQTLSLISEMEMLAACSGNHQPF